VKLQVRNRGKVSELEVSGANPTVGDLRKVFAASNPRFYADRQRWVIPSAVAGERPKVLAEGTLASFGLRNGSVVEFKDLGPQISYRTVFIVEYLGPLLIYPLFYLFPTVFYGVTVKHHLVQNLALACWVAHYLKRELESLFVHKFSHGTMPIMNIFKNSSYYWGFTAFVSYFVNHPLYTPPESFNFVYGALAAFVLSELLNLWSHMTLANLRPAGTTVRAIPRGSLFEFVSCPNYTVEITAWLSFSVMTHSLPALLFTLAGAAQMWLWAVQKHKKYRQEFDGKEGRQLYPRSRKVLIPFLL